jgi:hypothetical protein
MKAIRKTALVIMRLIKNEDLKKYTLRIKSSGKKGYLILCTDVLSGFSWLEKSNISTRYPARYKKIIFVNNSISYAYTWVYVFTIKKKTAFILPNGVKTDLEAGDTALRYASGAFSFIRDGKIFSLWQDLRKNEKVIFG